MVHCFECTRRGLLSGKPNYNVEILMVILQNKKKMSYYVYAVVLEDTQLKMRCSFYFHAISHMHGCARGFYLPPTELAPWHCLSSLREEQNRKQR